MKSLALLLLSVMAVGHALALDHYNPTSNTLRVGSVTVGDQIYQGVDVVLGQVLGLASQSPQAIGDTYNPATGVLQIPFVYVQSKPYTNVSVTVGRVLAVRASMLASDVMVSGLTLGAFRQQVLAAWQRSPAYIDKASYNDALEKMAASSSCYGFGAPDLIPPAPKIASWRQARHVPQLYPNRHKNYQARAPFRPKPVPFRKVSTDANVYAQLDPNVSDLRNYLTDMLHYLGGQSESDAYRQELISVLRAFATENALSEGLITNWTATPNDNTPVHFELLPLTLNLVHAFALVMGDLSVDDKDNVGNWINRLVSTTLKSSWANNRQDNKAYYRSQIALNWGVLIGDPALVENAMFMYKHAVHESRSDGSFINESSRGGSANLYQSQATDSILSLALGLEENAGLPAFAFSVDGKSVWSMAMRTLQARDDQVQAASQYGKSCEQGSFGTTASPDPRWGSLQSVSFLRMALDRDAPAVLKDKVARLPWDTLYYPEREGFDLSTLIYR